ncbi:MAG: hypothetical protein EON94_12840, partial [Caulobacteraceae bacterium]
LRHARALRVRLIDADLSDAKIEDCDLTGAEREG